jgi:hypothetical protein
MSRGALFSRENSRGIVIFVMIEFKWSRRHMLSDRFLFYAPHASEKPAAGKVE